VAQAPARIRSAWILPAFDPFHDPRWGSFVIGRKTIKKRMRAKMQAIKIELRKKMHDPIAKTGVWMKQMLQGHLNYFAVSACDLRVWRARGWPGDHARRYGSRRYHRA